jgi:hypothetical protein
MVARFISTSDIKNNSWSQRNYDKNFLLTPPSDPWNLNSDPDLEDIRVWEEIYYDPGIIGVYAAWDPYCEFYIIDYPFIKDTDKRFLKFYGFESSDKIQKILKKYNIEIPLSTVKINQ